MGETKYIQSSFTSGEISPRLVAHVDFAKRKNGLSLCENYTPTVHGPLVSRDGTMFVAETKDSSKQSTLVPFEFSTVQAYMLEFGNLYVRFFKDGGRIESPPGTPVEVTTAYTDSQVVDLKYAQSADTLYLVHGSHAPAKLTRTSHTDWTLSDVEFTDGPYIDENKDTAKKLNTNIADAQPDVAITGAANNGVGLIRITAIAHGLATNEYAEIKNVGGVPNANGVWKVTAITPDIFDLQSSTFAGTYTSGGTSRRCALLSAGPAPFAPFQAGHVGSVWRLKVGANWGYGRVVKYLSPTQVVWKVIVSIGGLADTVAWREGAWSGVRGYPQAITIYEQRLTFACTSYQPQTIWASVSDSYEDMTPGTNADDALTYTLGSNKVNVVRWLASGGFLIPGTVGEEFSVDAPNGSALTPTNVRARAQTAHGSSSLQAVRIGSSSVFVQRSGKKVRQLTFSQDISGYTSTDLTLLAEHIAGDGIQSIAYQQEPDTWLWCVREDGELASLTFLPSQEVAGWARHITDGSFERVAVIPSTDLKSDTAWYIVKRTIGGVTKRYVEYMDPLVSSDSALKYDGTVDETLTPGATTGTGVTFTAGSGVFSVSDVGKDIVLTEAIAGVSNSRATITAYVDPSTVTCSISYAFPNTSPIASGGWAIAVSSVSGLSHLEGKTVTIVGDGAVYPSKTVSGGSVTLDGIKAAVVYVGLPFTPKFTIPEPEVSKGDGDTLLGVKKRFARLFVRVYKTVGVWINGVLEDAVRSTADPMGRAPEPFTGDVECTQLGFEDKAVVTIEQRLPLKSTILALWGTLEYAEQ